MNPGITLCGNHYRDAVQSEAMGLYLRVLKLKEKSEEEEGECEYK